MRLVKVKLIEMPSILTPLERQGWINTWAEDMQRNGIAILSVNYQEDVDGVSIYKLEYIEETE